jgi:hypothetical protein
MILTEMVDGGTRIRHYSDEFLKIRQVETGIVYEDAVDTVPCPYTYDETDQPIEDTPIDPQEALDMIFGGEA